jgi:hypothetical protein
MIPSVDYFLYFMKKNILAVSSCSCVCVTSELENEFELNLV